MALGLASDARLSGYGGVHGAIALRQRVASLGVLRAEGILADGEIRGLATMASLELGINESWYGIAGGGASFDDGANPVWVSGVGRRLPGLGGDLSIELRYLSMQGGALYWSIGRAIF